MHEQIKIDSKFEDNNWELETDIRSIEKIEEAFARRLAQAGWNESDDENDAGILKIGFREALINAIAHGNLGVVKPDNGEKTLLDVALEKQLSEPTDKKIYVTLDISPERIKVIIKDEGSGFDWKNRPDPGAGDNLFKSKGRGILFMNSYFDSVTYNDLGNEVTMIKERL